MDIGKWIRGTTIYTQIGKTGKISDVILYIIRNKVYEEINSVFILQTVQ